jgi:glutathione S-transferase
MMKGEEITEEAYEKLSEALGWFSDFVKPTGYAAGTDHVTLADICLLSTYSMLRAVANIDLSKYKVLDEWYDRVRKEVPKFEDIEAGADGLGAVLRQALGLEGKPVNIVLPKKEQTSLGTSKSNSVVVIGTSGSNEVIQIFGQEESPHCRVVYMVCDMTNVPHERIMTDIMKGEHMTKEFIEV